MYSSRQFVCHTSMIDLSNSTQNLLSRSLRFVGHYIGTGSMDIAHGPSMTHSEVRATRGWKYGSVRGMNMKPTDTRITLRGIHSKAWYKNTGPRQKDCVLGRTLGSGKTTTNHILGESGARTRPARSDCPLPCPPTGNSSPLPGPLLLLVASVE